ncbi:hypothetical protein DID95_11795 [Vibrio fluvialis]|nr:hypothetical protein [Vibrio fluvialis]
MMTSERVNFSYSPLKGTNQWVVNWTRLVLPLSRNTARRSAPAQPTIMQIVRFLFETTMYRCAEAAHKKTSNNGWHLCAERNQSGVLIPVPDFAGTHVGYTSRGLVVNLMVTDKSGYMRTCAVIWVCNN